MFYKGYHGEKLWVLWDHTEIRIYGFSGKPSYAKAGY